MTIELPTDLRGNPIAEGLVPVLRAATINEYGVRELRAYVERHPEAREMVFTVYSHLGNDKYLASQHLTVGVIGELASEE